MMDTNKLYNDIDLKLRLMGINEYRIDGMSLLDDCLAVKIFRKKERNITLKIKNM